MLGSSPLTRGKQPTQALRPVGEFDHYVKRTPGCPFGQSRCPRCRAILLSEWTAFLTPTCDIVSLELIPAHAGKTRRHLNRPRPARLIPAHAGKTRNGVSPASQGWAHPRSRGENMTLFIDVSFQGGSSPLARGKLPGSTAGYAQAGLIPARAGKTTQSHSGRSAAPAHPRSRGENPDRRGLRDRAGGSSPLARGKHRARDRLVSTLRLIPARAGKTRSIPTPPQGTAAHPRSRGENSGTMVIGHRPPWLIPARAGKTLCATCPRTTAVAHPRSRGENCR